MRSGFNPLVTAGKQQKKPLPWTDFWLISIRMAKNEFHACAQAKSFSFTLFFPLPFFSISSFVAHLIFFLLHGIVAGQLFRKRDKYNLQRGIR